MFFTFKEKVGDIITNNRLVKATRAGVHYSFPVGSKFKIRGFANSKRLVFVEDWEGIPHVWGIACFNLTKVRILPLKNEKHKLTHIFN